MQFQQEVISFHLSPEVEIACDKPTENLLPVFIYSCMNSCMNSFIHSSIYSSITRCCCCCWSACVSVDAPACECERERAEQQRKQENNSMGASTRAIARAKA